MFFWRIAQLANSVRPNYSGRFWLFVLEMQQSPQWTPSLSVMDFLTGFSSSDYFFLFQGRGSLRCAVEVEANVRFLFVWDSSNWMFSLWGIFTCFLLNRHGSRHIFYKTSLIYNYHLLIFKEIDSIISNYLHIYYIIDSALSLSWEQFPATLNGRKTSHWMTSSFSNHNWQLDSFHLNEPLTALLRWKHPQQPIRIESWRNYR